MRIRRIVEISVMAVGWILLCAGSVSGAQQEIDVDGDTAASGEVTGEESPWEREYDEAMAEGREAYNAERRQEALDAFVQAIQLYPTRPDAYRNLARNYNLMGEYAKAVRYYDVYLELAPNADDVEVIDAERRGAIARGGDEAATTPADQRFARRALDRELAEGRAVTERGGGAWSMYRTLLDTGYAAPDLDRLRARLEQKVTDEFRAELAPEEDFIPVLSVGQLDLQLRRLEVLEMVSRSEERLQFVESRRQLLDGIQSLLNGDYETAVSRLERAESVNEDLEWVARYRIGAHERAGEPEEALRLVERLIAEGSVTGVDRRRAEVLRATLLGRLGRHDEAAEIFAGLLRR